MTSSRFQRGRSPGRLRRTLALACLASVGAFAGWNDLEAQVVVPDAPVRVEVRGVRNEVRDNVLATVALARTPENTRLAESRVRALMERVPREVATALEPFGFYEPSVRDTLSFDGRRWRVLLQIDSGVPVRLASTDVSVTGDGANDPRIRGVLERSALVPGEPLSHARYEALKSGLTTSAVERGYLDAAFDSAVVRVDRDRRSADVVLRLQTGPRFALGAVTFQQDVLDLELLQELVPWNPGDPSDGTRLLALQNALTAGPYFSSVEIVPRRDLAQERVVPVEVALTPARPQRYAVGAGYGSDTGPRVTLNAEIRRLNRSGHRTELEAWLAPVERRVAARYFLPLASRRASLLSFSAGFVDSHPETSDTETWLLGTTLAGLWGGWRGELGLSLQRADFEVASQSGIVTMLLLGTSVSRVRADDRIDPTWGSLVRLRVRGSHDAVVGDVRLLDMGAEARIIRSPAPRVRVRARAEVGALQTRTFALLPGSIRYFAGGDRSIRGFGYQELGPTDDAGEVIGGSRLLVGSVEVELRAWERWGLAVFADAGNAFTRFSDPREMGVGGGVRWRSPIGMIRLDGAFAVSEPGAPFRLHLNLGPEL
jgi:translocation and assembly module TamA